MRPYITRVKKYQEIQIAIAKLKKLIFERDLSISEFFRMCSNSQPSMLIQTESKPYFNMGG